MNTRRINDHENETQLALEKRRSSNINHDAVISCDDNNDIDDNDEYSSSNTFNLNKLLNRFGDNAELLELILTSKVEEDRRRTEEAKLKIKQLDYRNDKKKEEISSNHHPISSTRLPRLYNHHSPTDTSIHSFNNDSPPIRTPNFFFPSHSHQRNYQYTPELKNNHRLNTNENQENRKTSHTVSTHIQATTSLPAIDNPDDIKKPVPSFAAPSLSTQPSVSPASTSVPFSYLSHSNKQPSSSLSIFSYKPSSGSLTSDPSRGFSHQSGNPHTSMTLSLPIQNQRPSYSSPTMNNKLPIPQISQSHHHQEGDGHSRSPSSSPSSRQHPFKRRRREMQSITMIIETKEFPYNDNYNWKNNGNTVHKKSGQRSIYYKCSNAPKGCHVNKTVTFKGQGEYLIKYRGKHLINCSTSNQDPLAANTGPASSSSSSSASFNS
ncbi:hypothetical protein BCR42DRAFT_489860 [Absidia repens]|uniref:WRKY domain-containing protein n=1 Tax=Absidia repens TaxID=90262 RepID=A0A1X2IL58_9FUNG|nr:hypothetical protein BCR42DRAFT_489860 [Absidia repens]